MPRRFIASIVLSLLVGIVHVACERTVKPGDPCRPEDMRCLDSKTELTCQSGVFITAPCKGPNGCRESETKLSCDITGNASGDVCSVHDEGNARCIADNRQRIVCRAGAYVVEHCRGLRGCFDSEGRHACDQSTSEVGDPCAGKGAACSRDGKSLLECRGGRFAHRANCPGPSGCTVVESELSCDQKSSEGEH